jgi:transcriptional regulator GlxA family with amidase domain
MMVDELAQPGLGSQVVVESLMKAFLILVLRSHLRNDSEASPEFLMMGDPKLAHVIIDLLERPELPHTLESLALAAGMSRSAFVDRFRNLLGQSPNEFIQEVRLMVAARLLITTVLPIKTIAARVGYASRSYFSRAFRDVYAADPSAYRKGALADD